MLKSRITWIIFFLCLCVICMAVWFIHAKNQGGTVAVIKQGNTVIKTIDLSKVAAPYELKIPGEDGSYNIIYVEKGRIAVTEADCPDKICVKQGFIENGAVPIVCLPHRLTISIDDSASETDAVAGEN